MASTLQAPTRESICKALLDPTATIEDRYEAVYFCKSDPDPTMCDVLLEAFEKQTESILLRHEIVYVLGQLGNSKAVGRMMEILKDESEDELVRHEAAEGLASLRTHCDDLERLADLITPLGQTCSIALETLKQGFDQMCPCQYSSKDPALGKRGATEADVPEAVTTLLDQKQPLFDRYVAMFTLRNVGNSEAVTGLSRSLLEDETSALLRHEVAFVLGQMENEATVEALIESLARDSEHGMVRHESAIALGGIGNDRSKEALYQWAKDPDVLVSESCLVALAMIQYWDQWEELERKIKESKD